MSDGQEPTERERYLSDRFLKTPVIDSIQRGQQQGGNRRKRLRPNISAPLNRNVPISRVPTTTAAVTTTDRPANKEKSGSGRQFPRSEGRRQRMTIQGHQSVFEFGPPMPLLKDKKGGGRTQFANNSFNGMPIYETADLQLSTSSKEAAVSINDELEETYENELAPVNLPFLPSQIKYDQEEALLKHSKYASTDEQTTESTEGSNHKLLQVVDELEAEMEALRLSNGVAGANQSPAHRFVLLQVPDGFTNVLFSGKDGGTSGERRPVGKIKIYKSGRSILELDKCSPIPMAVETGQTCPFLQKVVTIDKECSEMNCLGDIRSKFIISPVIEKCAEHLRAKQNSL